MTRDLTPKEQDDVRTICTKLAGVFVTYAKRTIPAEHRRDGAETPQAKVAEMMPYFMEQVIEAYHDFGDEHPEVARVFLVTNQDTGKREWRVDRRLASFVKARWRKRSVNAAADLMKGNRRRRLVPTDPTRIRNLDEMSPVDLFSEPTLKLQVQGAIEALRQEDSADALLVGTIHLMMHEPTELSAMLKGYGVDVPANRLEFVTSARDPRLTWAVPFIAWVTMNNRVPLEQVCPRMERAARFIRAYIRHDGDTSKIRRLRVASGSPEWLWMPPPAKRNGRPRQPTGKVRARYPGLPLLWQLRPERLAEHEETGEIPDIR